MGDGRVCNRCEIYKPWSSFAINSKGKNGRKSICKHCSNKVQIALMKSRREKDPEGERLKRYHKHLRLSFNMSPEDYDRLFYLGDGSCWCCGKNSERLDVDHCHETGLVRGLLCFKCNTAIGKLGDTASSVMNAYNYLERFESNGEPNFRV